jgi:Uma2 family endonuclease
MATVQQATTEQHFLLRNVNWQIYKAISDALGDRPLRLTYDRGSLEFMTISPEHERYKKLLGRMVEALTLELNIPLLSLGSATCRREDIDRGLEPDECYYVQNEPAVRGKLTLDFSVDPPPDLAIEVHIARSSLNRQGIYAALGVPEIWRFDGELLRIYRPRADGEYEECHHSPSFPFLPAQELVPFLRLVESTDETGILRSFLTWARTQVVPRRQATSNGPESS